MISSGKATGIGYTPSALPLPATYPLGDEPMNSPSHNGQHKPYSQQHHVDTAHIAPVLRQYAQPLPALDTPAFANLFDRYADARVVMIGEASHGTHDFYQTRAAITQGLIERHGFNIVAVEADWPDAGHVDQYVRGLAHSA